MASILSHPAVPIALATALGSRVVPARLAAAAIVCSIMPDGDALLYWSGVPYSHTFGHRGFTHSIAFAVIVAAAAAIWAPQLQAKRWVACAVLFLSMLSHGVLDAMTTGGLGVGFFSPFSNHRYFLPWRVIEVSPIGLSRFFSVRGLEILASEVVTVWLPCLLFAVAGVLIRRLTQRNAQGSQSKQNGE
ncbi:MAG: metal-dependent hydrolase [Acidobacteriota bacterium]